MTLKYSCAHIQSHLRRPGEDDEEDRARGCRLPAGDGFPSRGARADDGGRFSFPSLPAGTYRVQATLIGYAPAVQSVVVSAGAPAETRFALRPTPLSLEEVQVTATPGEADARAVAQATTQLTGKGLERNLAGTVAQTLASQPGVRVRYNG